MSMHDYNTYSKELLIAVLESRNDELEAYRCAIDILRNKEQYMQANPGSDWRALVRILKDHTSPYVRPDSPNPTEKVVVYAPIENVFLRFEDKPVWDVYGTDYETVERAEAALAKAPEPRPAHTTFFFAKRSDS